VRRMITCLSDSLQRRNNKFERRLHHSGQSSEILRAAAISLWRGKPLKRLPRLREHNHRPQGRC
jgi:hypothetical protein